MLHPHSHLYYIAPSLKQGGELVWKNRRMPNFLKGAVFEKYVLSVNESEFRVIFKNGSFIKVDGAENYPAYAGVNPHGLCYDEMKDIDQRFFDVMEPNLATHQAWMSCVGTPPETEDNLFCKLADEFQRDAESQYFNMPTSTNPHISKTWLEKQKQRLIDRGEYDKWLREYMAQRVRGGSRAIFPMLEVPPKDFQTGKVKSYTKHVRPHRDIIEPIMRYPKEYTFHVAYDPGNQAAFGVLLCAVHKFTKKISFLGEIYEKDRNKTSSKIIYPKSVAMMTKIVREDRWRKLYDYAAAWFQVEVLNEFQVGLTPCDKDLKNKENKLSVIKDFLLENLWEASDECPNLISEMANYYTDEENRIPKKNDHLIDCMRYLFNDAGLYTVPREKYVRDPEKRSWTVEDDREFADEDDNDVDFYAEVYDSMEEEEDYDVSY